MPKALPEAKRLAILADYKAGKLSVPEICAKRRVGKNLPRELARAENLGRRSTRLPVGHKKPTRAKAKRPDRLRNGQRPTSDAPRIRKTIKVRPPKIAPEVWAAMCAKRAHYLTTIGPYPERVLHPERYSGRAAQPFRETREDGTPLSMKPQAIYTRKLRERRRISGRMDVRETTVNARAS